MYRAIGKKIGRWIYGLEMSTYFWHITPDICIYNAWNEKGIRLDFLCFTILISIVIEK